MTELSLADFDITSIVRKETIIVIGLGATGSAFLPHLAHYLKYNNDTNVHLYDFDVLEEHNDKVSLYGFKDQLLNGIVPTENKKVDYAVSILNNLVTEEIKNNADMEIVGHDEKVTFSTLRQLNKSIVGGEINHIFVFSDNSEVRDQVRIYQVYSPKVNVFDTRIGNYRDFEVFVSTNANTYERTLPYDENGDIKHIETNGVCLDDRMSYSVASTASSLLSNLFTQFLRDDLEFTNGLYHYIFGSEYKGVVKY